VKDHSREPLPRNPPVDLDASESQLIGKGVTLARVNLSFTSAWRLMQQGEFPRARTSGNKIVWLKSEIDSWIKSRPVRKYKNDTTGTPPPAYHTPAKARAVAKKAKVSHGKK
jgi:predicted DNA-binding transcriptional regulator AlpA